MSDQSLTPADEYALTKLPNGDWFGLRDVPFTVKNPRWRCDRLETKGKLEGKYIGTFPHSEKRWKKL